MLAPSADRVPRGAERDAILAETNRLWGRPASFRGFAGRHPISVTPTNLEGVRRVTHVVMPKTDGMHFLVLMTRAGGAGPQAYAVSRRLWVYRLALAAPGAAFDGTAFEAELVRRDAAEAAAAAEAGGGPDSWLWCPDTRATAQGQQPTNTCTLSRPIPRRGRLSRGRYHTPPVRGSRRH